MSENTEVIYIKNSCYGNNATNNGSLIFVAYNFRNAHKVSTARE